MNGRRSESRTAEAYYDGCAHRYDAERFGSETGRWVDSVQKSILSDLLGSSIDGLVVDLATGSGRIGYWLNDRADAVVGVDLSMKMLQAAQQKGISSLIRADAVRLPFREESFSVCVCVNALTLIPDYREVLREIRRVLLPGGRLICNFANLFSYYLPFGLMATLRRRAFSRQVYSRWHNLINLKRVFSAEGFRMESVLGHVHIPSYLDMDALLPVAKLVDRISRRSALRYLCPSLFMELTATHLHD